MSLKGRCLPFHFERTVSVQGASIRCDYRIQNVGDRPFPWLWCAHPLLPLSKELSLESEGRFQVALGLAAASELPTSPIRLGDLPWGERKWAAKLFSEHGTVDHLTVRHADGSGLRFAWDLQQIPYLGLWINNGAWSGCGSDPYLNIGIEPTMLPLDDLSKAQAPLVLNPADQFEWGLDVQLI